MTDVNSSPSERPRTTESIGPVETDSVQGGRVALTVTAVLIVLWACYSLNGFRGWWVPIALSDDDAGAAVRQFVFAGSAVVSLAVLWLSRRVWRTFCSQWPIVLLGAWLVVSVSYSDLPSTTAKRAILFLCGSITAVTVVAISDDPMRRVARLIVGVTGVAAWVSLAWMVAFAPEITTNPARSGLAGISNHPNTLAPALAIGLVMALGTPMGSGLGALWRVASAAGCALALALTTSITSIGLGVVSVALYAALRLPAYWKTLAALVLAGGVAGAMIWGTDRIAEELLGSVGRDTSMSGRGDLWGIVWAEARQTPVFGNGWGAFWIEGRGRDLVGTWNPRQSHNAYIDVILDVGFIGLALFAVLIAVPARTLFMCQSRVSDPFDRSVAAAMLSVLFSLLAVYGLQQSFLGKVDAFAFACVLLICAAGLERSRRERVASPKSEAS